MGSLFEKVEGSGITRRSFVQLSALAVAAAGLAGCSSQENQVESVPKDAEFDPSKEGKWVAAACWHNCGGRCVNKVYVVDGVPVRQKTDDSHEDSVEWPQQRSCLRGHSQRNQCFGADRIKWPMKRKNWEPLTGGDKQLRGRDEWERISWDEAYRYIADELRHAIDTYGNASIIAPGQGTNGDTRQVNVRDGDSGDILLRLLGGHVGGWDSSSLGSFVGPLPVMGIPGARRNGNDRFDIYNADYMVLYGANPSWSGLGSASWLLKNAKDRGVKFVVVGPAYNATGQMLDAEWIPVIPGMDTAMLLGVAYEMVQSGLVDQNFLDTYTVGFDGEHMPDDATINENFKAYLEGAYDNEPKTPEWASERCGTPVEKIKRLAEIMGKDNNVMVAFGFAAARTFGSWNLPQLLMTVSAMGGHMGKSGNSFACGLEQYAAYGGKTLYQQSQGVLPNIENPVKEVIPGLFLHNAILNGKYPYNGDPRVGGLKPVEEREVDIHVICNNQMGNFMENGACTRVAIDAYRKVDFVVSRGIFMTGTCKFSDIVLPVATKWEGPVTPLSGKGNTESLFFYQKVTDKLYESKTDQEINEELLTYMGVDPKLGYPVSEKARYFYELYDTKVMDDDGKTYVPMVKITQEDIDEWGVGQEFAEAGIDIAPHDGKIGVNELLEKGVYQVKRSEGDNFSFIEFADFIADPQGHPLSSKSGKFEIYCQAKADTLNSAALSDMRVKPYPTYVETTEGYAGTFEGGVIGGEKGDLPYVLYEPHYPRRTHSNLDNVSWLRETFMAPLFISKQDAEEKGVKTGDTVLVWSKAGRVLRQASIMPWLMPGVVALPHGGILDFNDDIDADMAGKGNMLLGPVRSDFGVTGYNNVSVNFELYDGEPLVPDWQKPMMTFED